MANKSDIQKCDMAIKSLVWESCEHPSLFDTISYGQTYEQAQNGKTEFTVIQVYGYWTDGEDEGAQVAKVENLNREKTERLVGKLWFYGE